MTRTISHFIPQAFCISYLRYGKCVRDKYKTYRVMVDERSQ